MSADGLISLYSDLNEDIGIHYFTIQVSIGVDVEFEDSFYVEIAPCRLTDVSLTTSSANINYFM